MIDYQPKTATEHRSRWSAATARVWDFSQVKGAELPPESDRPGLHPDQVFDFHDGLRLMVSVDRYRDGRDYLHVSASARPDSSVARKIKHRTMSIEQLSYLVEERVQFLSGRDVTLGYVTHPKGLPHYFDPPLEMQCL